MNEKEMIEKLEEVSPPHIQLPEAKAELRRELLHAPQFNENHATTGAPQLKFIVGAMAAFVIVALVFFINLHPERTLAKELLDNMRKVYDHANAIDKVHHLKMLFASSGQPANERESWIYLPDRKMRFLYRDAQTDEILAHLITDGEKRYGLLGSKFALKIDFETTGEIDQGTQPLKKTEIEDESMDVVIMPAPDEFQGGQQLLQAIIMSDAFDRDEFTRQSPREVVEKLFASPNVTYRGSEIDSLTGKRVDLLERRAKSEAISLKLIFSQQQLEMVRRYLHQLESNGFSELSSEDFIAQNKIRGDVQVKKIDVRETIKVFAETARIHQIVLSVSEDDQESYRAVKTFLSDDYLNFSPAFFDPQAFGLVLLEENENMASPRNSRNPEFLEQEFNEEIRR